MGRGEAQKDLPFQHALSAVGLFAFLLCLSGFPVHFGSKKVLLHLRMPQNGMCVLTANFGSNLSWLIKVVTYNLFYTIGMLFKVPQHVQTNIYIIKLQAAKTTHIITSPPLQLRLDVFTWHSAPQLKHSVAAKQGQNTTPTQTLQHYTNWIKEGTLSSCRHPPRLRHGSRLS